MAIPQLLSSMAMLLLMILPGFIFKRKKLVAKEHLGVLSDILINLIIPCIIIHSFQIEYSEEMSRQVFRIGGLWALMLIICTVILLFTIKALKIKGFEKGVLACILMIPNTGFIGIPIIDAFYGAEGLFYILICEIVSDLFLFTLVYAYLNYSAGVKTKRNIWDFFSPPVIATIIGFVLFRFNIQLPGFAGGAIEKIGSASTAIAMFVLGAQLEEMNIKQFFGKAKTYVTVGLRLVIVPLFAFVMLRFVFNDTSFMTKVFILAWSLPVGVFPVIFAEKLGKDSSNAAENVMLSNVLCLLTIPVWTLLV